MNIFPKPTTTSTTINYFSNHALEDKLAAYHYYIKRMFTLPLNKKHQHKEWTTILETAQSNNFPENLLIRLIQQMQQRITCTTSPTGSKNNTKWATFTYLSPQIRKITNLFKQPIGCYAIERKQKIYIYMLY